MDSRNICIKSKLGSIDKPLNFIIAENSIIKTNRHLQIVQNHLIDLNESYIYIVSLILSKGNIDTKTEEIETLFKNRSKKLKQLLDSKQKLIIIKDRLTQIDRMIIKLKNTLTKS